MNTELTLTRGDIVYFDFGCMHGSDYGTVVGQETTQWGAQVWVRKSDFSLTTVSSLVGEVTGKFHTDQNGDVFLSARGARQIGAYKLAA